MKATHQQDDSDTLSTATVTAWKKKISDILLNTYQDIPHYCPTNTNKMQVRVIVNYPGEKLLYPETQMMQMLEPQQLYTCCPCITDHSCCSFGTSQIMTKIKIPNNSTFMKTLIKEEHVDHFCNLIIKYIDEFEAYRNTNKRMFDTLYITVAHINHNPLNNGVIGFCITHFDHKRLESKPHKCVFGFKEWRV